MRKQKKRHRRLKSQGPCRKLLAACQSSTEGGIEEFCNISLVGSACFCTVVLVIFVNVAVDRGLVNLLTLSSNEFETYPQIMESSIDGDRVKRAND